jgi:hypothetical protein
MQRAVLHRPFFMPVQWHLFMSHAVVVSFFGGSQQWYYYQAAVASHTATATTIFSNV